MDVAHLGYTKGTADPLQPHFTPKFPQLHIFSKPNQKIAV